VTGVEQLTPSQTVGPYWHLLGGDLASDLTRMGAEGERIEIAGTIFDGDGAPVTDACLELWQSDPSASESFTGFGRCATDANGRYHFTTLKPGPVRGPGNGTQAPHIALTVLARGLLHHLVTRMYFAGEPLNDTDPVLAAIDPARRATVIASASGGARWVFDIRLQGEGETVFLGF
jgi:protocatechuate 3,4-dioxygenase alpha subunit